jgi:hypothetical protein
MTESAPRGPTGRFTCLRLFDCSSFGITDNIRFLFANVKFFLELIGCDLKVVDIVHQYDGRLLACRSLIQALR